MNNEEEFHKKRLAFAIINGKTKFIYNDTRGHKQWLEEDFGINEEKFEKIVRGYTNSSGDIVLYKGSDFNKIHVTNKIFKNINDIVIKSKEIFKDLEIMKVHNGVTIGKVGEAWQTKETIMIIKVKEE